MAEATTMYAVVTGANKGIGFAVCKQLASKGITVVLTARDEKRGLEAVEKLKQLSLPGLVVFHQLDVIDHASIRSFVDFIKNQFGKLDILVNNAGITGAEVDGEALAAANIVENGGQIDWSKIITQTYEQTELGIKTNYYGAKDFTEALIPLLQLSSSPKVVNVSSSMGKLENLPNGWPKEVFSDVENLIEEKFDEVLNKFLKDFNEGSLENNGWPININMSTYIISKVALNAYTRVAAKKYPSICINAVCPGFVKTDINYNTGYLTPDEGAESIVRYAVVTGPNKGIGFEICKQLASKGITVIVTARAEKRGLEALDKLKEHLDLNHSHNDNLLFYHLDVTDPTSITSLANFIKAHFGKLDILVNNAGLLTDDEELYEACIKTNYYGVKELTKALIPLLQFSTSPKIVNVSSTLGRLENIPNGWPKEVLSDVENLTEEKIDKVLNEFLKDFKEGSLESKGWPVYASAYSISKVALSAYTRILATKYPTICINAICPGYIKTDIKGSTGTLTHYEGAVPIVKLALLPKDSPSGLFFSRYEDQPY